MQQLLKKWILDPLDPALYIRLVKTDDTEQQADSITEIDFNPYVLTEYDTQRLCIFQF